LTKSKTALRKVIKRTHKVIEDLKLKLHPLKTYIGKISHGFNFLGYYMDDQKILPSQETIRRFHERAVVIYDHPPETLSRRQRSHTGRDISEYPVNEEAPCDDMLRDIITSLVDNTFGVQDVSKRIRQYIGQWSRWVRIGLSTIDAFIVSIKTHLPSLASCWGDVIGAVPIIC
jgi:hypothetical protein